MKLRPSTKSDLPQIENLLKRYDLPYEDCNDHIANFLLVEAPDSKRIIATGAFEHYGDVCLLRSIAGEEDSRGKNIGDEIYSALKARAAALGVSEIYLLTQSAEKYFKARGFLKIGREFVPDEIKKTKQYSGLCPSTATVMKVKIQ